MLSVLFTTQELRCGSPYFLGIFRCRSVKWEGAEGGNRVQMAVDTMEITHREMSIVNPLNFIPEYMEYIRLGSRGTTPNFH